MGPLPSGGLSRVLDSTLPAPTRANATPVARSVALNVGLLNQVIALVGAWFRPAVATPTRFAQVPTKAIKILDPNPNRVGLMITNMPASVGNVYWSDSPGVQGALGTTGGGGVFGQVIAPGATVTFGPECRGQVMYAVADLAGTEIRIAEQIAAPLGA